MCMRRGVRPAFCPELKKDDQPLTDNDRVYVQEYDDHIVVTMSKVARDDADKYAINVANDSGSCNIPLKVSYCPLEISNVSKDCARLSWKPPKDEGGSKLIGYIVERRDTAKGPDAYEGTSPTVSLRFESGICHFIEL
ncbi:unnamed protein product, partial [Rotaria sp. Silwood2]